MRGNKVFLNKNGIVEIKVVGNQTTDSVAAMGDEAMELAKKQRAAGKRVLVLDGLTAMGDVPPEARKLVVEYAKTIDYDRAAMVGNGGMLRLGANLMLHATGKADKVKYFDDYDQATTWLLNA